MMRDDDRRRQQRNLEETPSNRQTVMLKLTAWLMGETPGPVFHAVYVEHPKYPAVAGAGTLTYSVSTRATRCWVPVGAFDVGMVVLAIEQSGRFYAVGKMA
jgi:hypothetical protein